MEEYTVTIRYIQEYETTVVASSPEDAEQIGMAKWHADMAHIVNDKVETEVSCADEKN